MVELPAARVAFTTRGQISAADHIKPLLERDRLATLADVLAKLPPLLHELMAHAGAFRSDEDGRANATTLYLAYYDPVRRRSGGLIMSSTQDGMPTDYAPWSWLPIREGTAPGVEMVSALGRDACPTDPTAFDPVTGSIAVATAQRREPWAFNSHRRAHYVAGDLRLTEVGPAGVSTRIIHSWPDRPGERVRA